MDNTNWISSIATAIMSLSVFLILLQIWFSQKQAKTEFEDSLTKEFRELIKCLPVDVLLGKDLIEDYENYRKYFYQYFDLTNEQAFLHQKGRISDDTWKDWCEGIESLLSKPAFKKAWDEFKEALPGSFTELRCLENNLYNKCKK
jgi:hypothetical protein